MRRLFAVGFALVLVTRLGWAADDFATLGKLADDFWTWRAKYAPFSSDDVNRIERPGGTREWSRTAIDQRGKELTEFISRWKKIDSNGWPIPQKVDYRLIGSALARVEWSSILIRAGNAIQIFISSKP
jgi:hypothetical protein